METTRGRTAWPAVAAAIAGFVVEATVAAVPGSPLQPVLAPGADPGGPFVWLAELVGLDRLRDGLPVASVLGVAAGMAGFLILLRAAWRGDLSIRVALGLAIAFHVGIVLLPLLISRDVYSYIAHGQIVSMHHANPYVQTPADFPGFLSRTLVGRQWVDTPSVYGPLFTHLAGLVTRTTSRLDGLVDAFRLIAIAASLATTFVIAAVTRLVRPGRAAFAVAAFGLNPVILFQSAGSGHNDLLVALGIALAAWCVLEDRTHWAVVLVSCAALVKATAFLPLLLLVIWVAWRRPPGERVRAGVTHAALGFAVVVLVAAPFFQWNDPTLGMLELSSHEGWLAPSRFFRRVLDAISADTLGVIARVAFAGGLVAAVVWLVRGVARAASSGRPALELLGGWGWALLALTMLGPVLLPWYLAWSLPLIWILPRVPRISLIALSVVLALSQWTAEPLRFPDAYDLNILIGHYALTPIVIGLLVWLGLDLRRRLSIPLALHDEEDREPAETRQH
jgi:alpha-1,6-mannosyltransferase